MNTLVNSLPLGIFLSSVLIVHSNSQFVQDTHPSYNSVILQNIIPTYIQALISSQQLNQYNESDVYKGLNKNCQIHLGEWIGQLETRKLDSETWALEMIDAWAKFPEGVLSGHTTVLGDFDQCLKVRAQVNIPGQEISHFKGQFCHSVITTNLTEGVGSMKNFPTSFQIGTCYPSSCSVADVNTFQRNVIELVQLPIVSSDSSNCYTDDSPRLTPGDVVMISVLGVIAALCLVGTIFDVFYRRSSSGMRKTGRAHQALMAFSLYTNTLKWASTKVSKEDIGCIHGIRFFTTCWVILLHTWSMIFYHYQPSWNSYDASKVHEGRWTMIAVLNGMLAVDTFFAIGGLLVSNSLLKMLNKSGGFKGFDVPKLYLHRYIRLTPVYAVIIGILATWFSYLRSGPIWAYVPTWGLFCKRNWWHNLLYINNLIGYSNVGDDAMCSGDSWYLAADMQFFIIAPILIYPLWKWRRIGLLLFILVTIGSLIIPVMITYEHHLIPTFLPYVSLNEALDYTMLSYMKPWTRFGPYVAGLWAGFFLYERKNKGAFKISKSLVFAGWTISTAGALAIVFGLFPYYDFGSNIPNLNSAFYAGFHRFGWGIIICWVILACLFGHGGWINEFLSWKAFIPLGRLSFCVYLISYKLQLLFHLGVRQATTYNVYTTTNLFFSHVVMSFLVAFIFFITIETPFLELDKLIFARGPQESSNDNERKKQDAELRNNPA